MTEGVWSSGMIPASGAGGPEFDSPNSPESSFFFFFLLLLLTLFSCFYCFLLTHKRSQKGVILILSMSPSLPHCD